MRTSNTSPQFGRGGLSSPKAKPPAKPMSKPMTGKPSKGKGK